MIDASGICTTCKSGDDVHEVQGQLFCNNCYNPRNWNTWTFTQSEARKLYAFVIQSVINNERMGKAELKSEAMKVLNDIYNKRNDPSYDMDCFDDLIESLAPPKNNELPYGG